MKKNVKEKTAKALFMACALVSIIALCVILFYIFSHGAPAIANIGIIDFLFGTEWEPRANIYGILPMILTTLLVSFAAFAIGSFLGKWAAIYLSKYAHPRIYKIVKPMIELLAGIPSVIFGFFGVMVIVPFIRNHFGGPGKSILAAIIILVIMIIPTIINLSESAIRAVPSSYYEGALALGATHNEAVFNVVVPAAKSGIQSAFILGIGRAIGETMAVILVIGNNPRIPTNIFKPSGALTSGIALEMGYASGLHRDALFGIGVVLFTIILILNVILTFYKEKEDKS